MDRTYSEIMVQFGRVRLAALAGEVGFFCVVMIDVLSCVLQKSLGLMTFGKVKRVREGAKKWKKKFIMG